MDEPLKWYSGHLFSTSHTKCIAEYGKDLIRLSPDLTKSVTRDKHYRITQDGVLDKVYYVKLQADKLNSKKKKDFFFLNNDLLAVPLIGQK